MEPKQEGMTYEEAALFLGYDHHYVRQLTSRGVLEIDHLEEVRPHVNKVYLTTKSVETYHRLHAVRLTARVKLTKEQWQKFTEMFGLELVHRRDLEYVTQYLKGDDNG